MKKEIKRRCQGCREVKNRDDLIKITKLNNGILSGTLKINPKSNELGRSVYVCKNPECINTVIKKKGIKAGLKYSNKEEIEKIEKELLNIIRKFS